MVDLGGYIIILTNDDGKIKLYGMYIAINANRIRQVVRYSTKSFASARAIRHMSLEMKRQIKSNAKS